MYVCLETESQKSSSDHDPGQAQNSLKRQAWGFLDKETVCLNTVAINNRKQDFVYKHQINTWLTSSISPPNANNSERNQILAKHSGQRDNSNSPSFLQSFVSHLFRW